jgi:hypothetical protein
VFVVKADAGYPHVHRFINVRQQSAIVRNAREQREVHLRDAESQIGPVGFAP